MKPSPLSPAERLDWIDTQDISNERRFIAYTLAALEVAFREGVPGIVALEIDWPALAGGLR